MRILGLVLTALGIALLAGLVSRTDLAPVAGALGLGGTARLLAVLLPLYVVYFAADTLTWQSTLDCAAGRRSWFLPLFAVRMVGDAYNNITPTASMGGDAIKIWLLRRRHGIAARESGASLVISRTTSMLALLAFTAIACVMLAVSPVAGALSRGSALAGLAAITLGTGVFFAWQYLRITTRIARRAGRSRFGERLRRAAELVEDIDGRIAGFYRARPRYLLVSVAAAFATWVLGAAELWLVLDALGLRLGIEQVWCIEASAQVARAVGFLVPAGLGVQDAALVAGIVAAGGSFPVAVATALLRRLRELVWVGIGVGIGGALALDRKAVAASVEQQSG